MMTAPATIPMVTATAGAYQVAAGLWAVRVSDGTTHVTTAYTPHHKEARLLAEQLRRWMCVR